MRIFNEDEEIRQVLVQLVNGTYSPQDPELFRPLYNSLLQRQGMDPADRYFILADFRSYIQAQHDICEAYKDSFLTNEEVNSLVNLPMWFVASADDTTVDPTQFSIPTFQRIKNAGNTNAHFSFFEHVYGEDTGKQVQYMGHYSWVYAFRDEVKLDQADVNNIAAPSTAAVQINGKNVGLWDWLAAQHK